LLLGHNLFHFKMNLCNTMKQALSAEASACSQPLLANLLKDLQGNLEKHLQPRVSRNLSCSDIEPRGKILFVDKRLNMNRIKPIHVLLNLFLVVAAARSADVRTCSLTADVDRAGPAISPYLYGQFIEHLGRCIRDGIWAEKLRDRKFLLEPGKTWQVLKPEGAAFEAFHDPAGAYAGNHCMAMELRAPSAAPCGIVQTNIILTAGKEYSGYIVLASLRGPAKVQVRLHWGENDETRQSAIINVPDSRYRKVPFRFRAGATTDAGKFSVCMTEPGLLWIGCVSLMPADNKDGMRTDTLALIRKLGPPITRWPGGNFVSGYSWKDGIGERDRRPPRWERAWNDVEDNDFGVDDFLRFCEMVGTEPYIAVNTGLGSAADAADEVEYVTGSPQSRWGAVRAQNGRRSPYKVTWWGIGNEMYGDWQLGHVSVERYAARHNAFVAAMKARNPAIKIIAVGSPGRWNDVILPQCAANMDLLSAHHYSERKLRVPLSPSEAVEYERNFDNWSGDVAAGIRRLVSDFRQRLDKGDNNVKKVRLAIDEWGIVRDWNSAPDGPGVGAFEHYYMLGDAIAAARALHEILRCSDVVAMANWAQTVNVIATIKTRGDHAVLDPVGHVLAAYKPSVAGAIVPVTISDQAKIDAVAAWNPKKHRLALGLINYSPDISYDMNIRLGSLRPTRVLTASQIDGPSLDATNVPGKPEQVTTRSLNLPNTLDGPVPLPPHSITVLELECR